MLSYSLIFFLYQQILFNIGTLCDFFEVNFSHESESSIIDIAQACIASDLERPQRAFSSLRFKHSTHFNKTSSRDQNDCKNRGILIKSTMSTNKNPQQGGPLFKMVSYDIRYLIYRDFIPVGSTIHLTVGVETACLTTAEDQVSSSILNLLRTCRQIDQEVSHLLYQTNTFLLVPGEINIRKMSPFPHSNQRLFLKHLRKSTLANLKCLEIHLTGSLSDGYIDSIGWEFTCIKNIKMSFTATPKQFGPNCALFMLRALELCKKLSEVRPRAWEEIQWDGQGGKGMLGMLTKMLEVGWEIGGQQ